MQRSNLISWAERLTGLLVCLSFMLFSVTSASAANAKLSSRSMTRAVAHDLTLAKSEVKAATANGPGALAQLVNSLDQSKPASNGGTTASEYALGLSLESSMQTGNTSSGTSSTPYPSYSPSPFSSPQGSAPAVPSGASAVYCYYVRDSIWDTHWWNEGPVEVAWIQKDHAYWCGNGYNITQNGLTGYFHQTWAQFPWCIDIGNNTGWDGPNQSWAHSIIYGSFGLTTPWDTCGTWSSGTAQLRIAGSGYWDSVDDF